MDRYLHAFSTTADRKLYLRTKYLEPFVSATTTESSGATHVAHYQNITETPCWDGRIWAYYNVTDVENPTTVLYTTTNISDMIVDGESVTPATTYTFDTEGEHLVKFALSGTAIAAGQFRSLTQLTKVFLPETVATINENAFNGDTSLQRVSIGRNVSTVSYAFEGCSALSRVDVPNIDAFLNCTFHTSNGDFFTSSTASSRGIYVNDELITSIIVPQTKTTLGLRAFRKVNTLTSITLHNGITSIPGFAFADCTGLTSMELPNGITSIATYAFASCTNLSSINFPSGITSIGTYAFYNCKNLAVNVNLPNVTSVGQYAFSQSKIISFTNTKTSTFGTGVFEKCKNISSINVTGNITSSYIFGGINSSSTYANNIIINGNVSQPLTNANGGGNSYVNNLVITGNISKSIGTGNVFKTIRVGGSITAGGGSMGVSYPPSGFKFFEVMGNIINAQMFYSAVNGLIYHLGYNNVVTVTPSNLKISNTSKIYVGDGSSQAADQAVLDQYLADDAWSAYSDKLDLWYNYTGEYKTT